MEGAKGIPIPSKTRPQGPSPPAGASPCERSLRERSKQCATFSSSKKFFRTLVFDITCGVHDAAAWAVSRLGANNRATAGPATKSQHIIRRPGGQRGQPCRQTAVTRARARLSARAAQPQRSACGAPAPTQRPHPGGATPRACRLPPRQQHTPLAPPLSQVGFVETEQAAERKSGAGAWSMRLHDRVVELPYDEFCGRFSEEVPYHRIAFFRHDGAVVWESDELRSKLHPGEELYGSSGGAAGHGSWHQGSSWHGHHGPSPLGGPRSLPRAPVAGASPPPLPGAAAAAVGFARPPKGGAPPLDARGAPVERPAGGVASLLAAAAAAEGGSARGSPAVDPRGGSGKARRRRPQGTGGGGADDAWRQHDQRGGGTPLGASPSARGAAGSSSGPDGTPTPPRRRGSARGRGAAARELAAAWEGGDGGGGGSAGPSSLRLPSHLERRRRGGGSGGRASDDDDDGGGGAASDDGSWWGDEGGEGSEDAGDLAVALEEEFAAAEEEAAAAAAAAAQQPPAELRDYGSLPDSMWLSVLGAGLGVRDLCYVARASRALRGLAVNAPTLWAAAYRDLHGEPAPEAWATQAVRRACRRSELRAARWLEASAPRCSGGFPGTTCLALDGSKAVSGDGGCLRVWSTASGRRIATLPGHPGRLAGAAFDDDTLVSGCSAGVVKLWRLDELRCARTLRHHAAPVAGVALLNGLPISGGEDGEICLWDAGAAGGGGGGGAPILSLAADGPLAALDAVAASGRLLSAGWDVDVWDVGAAARLASLVAPPHAAAGGGGGGFTSIGSGGSLVAAGRAGEVVLWDVRSARCVGVVPACGAAAGGAVADAPAAAEPPKQPGGGGAAEGGGGGGAGGAPCVGVQLDDWKLVTGWGGARSLGVYDLRSLPGGSPRPGWAEPVLTLRTPARVTCFRFHEQTLVAGQEGAECALWTFGPPAQAAAAQGCAPAADGDAADEWGSGGCGRRRKDGRKDKKAAVPKGGDRRYPKRRTR
ncbi:MAG: hypothetical protein J3K34DRAFT_133697 [Monoraphidium minutum]|nr:MAG: hypothetical protein J3K34DRAFT_133697 [Monoraphidium minutum]